MRSRLTCLTFIGVAFVSLVVGVFGGGLAGAGVASYLMTQNPRVAVSDQATQLSSSPVSNRESSSVTQVTLEEESAVTRAVEKVGPAVVTVESTSVAYSLFFEPMPETGVGSGVIFDPRGYILTNRHVVEDAKSLNVTLSNKEKYPGKYPAKLIGLDSMTDLAVIKIELSDLPVAEIGDSSKLRPGQLVVAIGSPLGTYQNSVTTGVVSALGRTVTIRTGSARSGTVRDIYELIQTDAAINRGNSGGPLINSLGQVIGINTLVASQAQNIGFSISINSAKPVMVSAVNEGKINRAWLGVRHIPLNKEIAQELSLPVERGSYIYSDDPRVPAIMAGSPAEKAGVKTKDIILEINGNRISPDFSLVAALLPVRPGDKLRLKVLREGKESELEVTVGVAPER